MMKNHISLVSCITLVLLLTCSSANSGKLYRWVDANGEVSFSDKVPPEDSKRERAELSESGRTIAIKEAAKTPEQLQILKKIRALQKTKQSILDKQLKEDDVLLRTFQSAAAIDATLTGKLGMLDTQILQTKKQTNTLFKQLLVHQKSAAHYERRGKKIPDNTLKNIDSSQSQYDNNQKKINRLELQKITLTESFQRDKIRLLEIQLNSASKPVIYNEGTPSLALGEIKCSPNNCALLWNKAVEFARQSAMTEVTFKSKNLLLTAEAKEESQLTIALVKDTLDNDSTIYLDIYCKDSKKGKKRCKSKSAFALVQQFNALITSSLPNE